VKTELTIALIKSLRLDKKPVGRGADGRILYEDNPRGEPYFVFDASSGAPPGFGVKVAKRKTFVVQRKVEGKTFRATLGSVAEFLGDGGMEAVRVKAAQMGASIRASGVNPNVAARRLSAAEVTLGMAFADYRSYIANRKDRPAKKSTLKVFDRACRKFTDWHGKKIRELSTEAIKERFVAGEATATSTEQAFRTAYSVVRRVIEIEALAAEAARRDPLLTANPFGIIGIWGMYRSKETLERERKEKMVRNPLTPSDTLGKFLEALWAKRLSRQNRTGCDYLLLTLLMGARKSECANLKWAELLTEQERIVNSWVDLEKGKVFFYRTKNGQDHLLPLGPCAIELLRRRQQEVAEELFESPQGTHAARKWVFPARNAKNQAGHYKDAQDLLSRIRDIAGIPVLTRHDLRRSFGSVLTQLEITDKISKRFMNHNQAETHNQYTAAEWALMQQRMTQIEEAILIRGPNVWNSLKPADKSPLPAQPLPEVPKDKPRTGRPRKSESANADDSLETRSESEETGTFREA
jgi:integrase